MGLLLRRPSDAWLATFLREQSALDVTYEDVGVTRGDGQPRGFHLDVFSVPLGADFDRAKDGLRAWAGHAAAGVQVNPPNAPLVEGQTVAMVVRSLGLWMVAPCRIVWTVDEPDAFGFGYGTLPGHPECGEEAFVINRRAGGVTFDIRAVSRAKDLLPRLGGPVTRALQIRTTRAYLRGLQDYVARR